MTFLTNTAAGGVAGTAATTANTGGTSGDAFSSSDQQFVSPNTGLWEFSSTASHGSVGYRVQGTAVRSLFSWNSADFTPSLMLTQRFYIRIPAAPSVAVQIMQLRNSAGQAAALNITTARNLQLTNAAGTGLWNSAAVLAVDTWYRVELAVQAGTTTANGVANLSYYALDSGTAIDSVSVTNGNFGITNLTDVRWGKVSSAGNFDAFIDSIKIDSSSLTFLGPHIVSVASARPAAIVSNPGAWADVGGAGGIAQALADESDATYAISPATPNGAAFTVNLNGVLQAGPVTDSFRARSDSAGVTMTIVADLFMGTTLIATRSFVLTTSFADYSFTTDTAETNAITSRTDLRLRYTATQS